MAKDWKEHNNRIFKAKLNQFAKDIELRIIKISEQTADEVLEYITSISTDDDEFGLPLYTSNLYDSTGLGIYRDSVLTKFKNPQEAKTSQWSRRLKLSGIRGHEYLEDALTMGSTEFASGIWLVLYSAVPYAAFIEEGTAEATGRGIGFFSDIADNAERIITMNLKVEFPNANIL